MIFNSLVFITLFLPFTICLYWLFRKLSIKYAELFLIICNFSYIYFINSKSALIIFSIIILNWVITYIAYYVKRVQINWLAIILDVCVLVYYKYWNFIIDSLNMLLKIHLPNIIIEDIIGISFIIFILIAYVIDTIKGNIIEKNLRKFLFNISFFAKTTQGPITRYTYKNERFSINNFGEGIERFVVGLSKIVIIVSSLSILSNYAFETENRSTALAWAGGIAYMLQIFYDFSGCMDMAIGIGKMFSIELPENFNYPYVSTSVSEFWRRWHITLGQWFKDYLYIPLGGNRCRQVKMIRNLLVVWLITGLWHGANWTFIFWGLWHFAFVLFEKVITKKDMYIPIFLRWLYTMNVVFLGWILFRSSSIEGAMNYIFTLFGVCRSEMANFSFEPYAIINSYKYIYLIAIIGVFPIKRVIFDKYKSDNKPILEIIKIAILIFLFLGDISFVFKSRYAAPIYFTF